MTTLLYILKFLIGLTAIIKGADYLTDGAADIARRFGIPSLVVGLTIVAMGSSAPEFVVSVVSAMEGNTDMALGNVVGSNIFNILAIMGITAMVREIKVERSNVRNDVPFALLSSVAIAITAMDSFFNGNEVDNGISRTDGMLLLCLFAVFMSYTMSIASNGSNAGEEGDTKTGKKNIAKSIIAIIGGLAALILGGDWFVDGASGIAETLGVSQSIIALTIVSMGTSAPELAASVMAARKGDTAMALGNVVGSVVFNVFFVLGAAATIHPLGIGGITVTDILVLLVASALLWIFCKFGKTYYTLTRMEGFMLVLLAAAYYVYLCLNV